MNKIPLKIGVQLDSPAIVYIYKESGSLRMRRMPLRNFWANTDVEFVLEDIRNRHGEHIADIPDRALRKMLNIVKQHKGGKSLQQIISGNIERKQTIGDNVIDTHEIIFNKLQTNIRGGSNITTTGLATQKVSDNKNEADNFKKKEFPQRTTFATLYESGNENNKNKLNGKNETKSVSGNSFNKNANNNSDFYSGEDKQSSTKRPTTLEINNFELTTSFNTYTPQERKIHTVKSGFLQDLEKDLAGTPEKDGKADPSDRLSVKKTSVEESKKEKEFSRLNEIPNRRKQHETSKSRNEDDTDVEFDDSDNPLDDPEEDFW